MVWSVWGLEDMSLNEFAASVLAEIGCGMWSVTLGECEEGRPTNKEFYGLKFHWFGDNQETI